jgi:hypothetical protein
MTRDKKQLLAILAIGHDTSMRGEGISLRDARVRTDYANARIGLTPADLLPLIRSNDELVTQWVMYSEDKRTSGGWYLDDETCSVGRVNAPDETICFNSVEEAVADYVLRELDYWSEIQ